LIFRYDPDTDTLYIQLVGAASVESEEVAPGIVLDFDTDNRVIGIEIEGASKWIDLSKLEISALPIKIAKNDQKTALLEFARTLPDSLAREAEARGLLTPQTLEFLLRAELRRRRIQNLFDAADRLAALELLPLTEAEIEVEVQAARTARRTSHASGS
jgi:uncharacterized protein YuzE